MKLIALNKDLLKASLAAAVPPAKAPAIHVTIDHLTHHRYVPRHMGHVRGGHRR